MSRLLRNLKRKASRLLALARQHEEERARAAVAGTDGPLIPWRPFPDKDGKPSPQRRAYECLADELFYGGAAGAGKTDLLLGISLTAHRSSIIFRRQYTEVVDLMRRARTIIGDKGRVTGGSTICARTNDGRLVDFGAVQHPDDREKFRGRPHDGIFFDELPTLSREAYKFLIGWNRNAEYPQQRCRVVGTGNPPTRPEDRWIIEEWAPWLDGKFPDPAEPGELRWYTVLDGKMTWLKPGVPHVHVTEQGQAQEIVLEVDPATQKAKPFRFVAADGREEEIQPRSRTFIPGRVDDNPILLASGYKAVLQATPEPLRSQLLYGDFNAGVADDAWQVIPTEWVRQAQTRWTENPPAGQKQSALGVDVAYGGADATAIVARYGNWFSRAKVYRGAVTHSGSKACALVLQEHRDDATINVDVIGYGASCYDHLKEKVGNRAVPVNVSKPPMPIIWDRAHRYKLVNVRAAMYWVLREALDPEKGSTLALPPDPLLLAELCAARYEARAEGIIIEPKEAVRERLGHSPDVSDATCLAHFMASGYRYEAVSLREEPK